METLEEEGCFDVGDLSFKDEHFEVQGVQCEDGRTYKVTLNTDYEIVNKIPE